MQKQLRQAKRLIKRWYKDHREARNYVQDMRKNRNDWAIKLHRAWDSDKGQYYYQQENENYYVWLSRLEELGIVPDGNDIEEAFGYVDRHSIPVFSGDIIEGSGTTLEVLGNMRQGEHV